ncbi:MAG: PPOX class F420-dependent oxidoreductase [Thermomicrobiales bacterium]
MAQIPDAYQDLFDRPILIALATVQPDGQPQVTPVWGDYADGHVRINTAAGRQKYRNLKERPQVTVLVVDPDNGQRYIEVRGKVAEVIEDDPSLINKLSNDYIGTDYPWFQEGEVRVTFLIEPEKVVAQG